MTTNMCKSFDDYEGVGKAVEEVKRAAENYLHTFKCAHDELKNQKLGTQPTENKHKKELQRQANAVVLKCAQLWKTTSDVLLRELKVAYDAMRESLMSLQSVVEKLNVARSNFMEGLERANAELKKSEGCLARAEPEDRLQDFNDVTEKLRKESELVATIARLDQVKLLTAEIIIVWAKAAPAAYGILLKQAVETKLPDSLTQFTAATRRANIWRRIGYFAFAVTMLEVLDYFTLNYLNNVGIEAIGPCLLVLSLVLKLFDDRRMEYSWERIFCQANSLGDYEKQVQELLNKLIEFQLGAKNFCQEWISILKDLNQILIIVQNPRFWTDEEFLVFKNLVQTVILKLTALKQASMRFAS